MIGGTITGRTSPSSTRPFPGNWRRASTYAAGSPSASATAVTMSPTSTVTHSTCASPNSATANRYHLVVYASGSHPPNHVAANEFNTTDRTMPSTSAANTATSAYTHHTGRSPAVRLTGRAAVRLTRARRSTGRGTPGCGA